MSCRGTRAQLLRVGLVVPGNELLPYDVVEFFQRLDIQTLHRTNDISLDNTNVAFYMTLTPRLLDARRLGNSPVVSKKFNVPGIQDALFIVVLPVYSRGAIIRDDESRHTVKEVKGIRVPIKPGRHLFVQKTFAIEEPTVLANVYLHYGLDLWIEKVMKLLVICEFVLDGYNGLLFG